MPECLYLPIRLGEEYVPKLPISSKRDTLNFISGETLVDLINQAESIIIIDCRFDYEFAGGHIHGAVNLNDTELLEKHLFSPQNVVKNMEN